MSLPDKFVQVASDVLLHHRWPEPGMGNNCSCGGVPLGGSIPEHQARLILSAVFVALPFCEEAVDVVAAALVEAWDKQPYVGQVAMQDTETALAALAKLVEP